MYNHQEIEKKWGEKWQAEKIYQPDLDKAAKPFYNLMMFPYPSAEGLHVGNMYAFVHADAYGRFKRLKGYDVFEPIGLDGFGIHSENYAIKIKEHIKDVSARTEKHFYEQLHMIGNAYDWTRTVETYKPNYYKWTQWLFLKMFERGLAYRKAASVNWCPSCKTVLSDEQVIAGDCERCGTATEKRQMEQWFWRITDYADKLLDNLETLDWSEEVKTIQKNWIGRSEGASVKFEVRSKKLEVRTELEVFTTRPDTLFGCTYMVVNPEHELITNYKLQITNYPEVEKYIRQARKKSEIERADETKEKTGVKLEGLVAVNPVNNEEIPIFVADYVLAGYGTGAIMAVPAHDERDYEFAKKYKLPTIKVIVPPALGHILRNAEDIAAGAKTELRVEAECFTGEGTNINSGFLDGLPTAEAKKKINAWLEEKGIGTGMVNYKLRDWCVSRQRYWGPPIPVVYCDACKKRIENSKSQISNNKKIQNSKLARPADGFKIRNYQYNLGEVLNPGWIATTESELPVTLPDMTDFLPDGTGKGPLNKIKDFVYTTCPKCGGPAERETDVSDPFVDSSWYFMRYLCTDFTDRALDKERLEKWMPVDIYIGGKEHAVLHLLYSRFVTMVMHELGLAPAAEPYKKFRAHGLLIREGAKISKSKGNIVNPDEYIERYGADAVRLYLMFLGDMRQGGDWRDTGMAGMYRFVKRVYGLWEKCQLTNSKFQINPKSPPAPKLRRTGKIQNSEIAKLLHKTIKGVGEDLENLKYNTAIAKLMILVNAFEKEGYDREQLKKFSVLLSPFAPFLAEELWSNLGHKASVFRERWPEFDPTLVKDETIHLVVQINGKLRDTIEVTAAIGEEEAKKIALKSERIKKWLEGKEITKVIYVKGKLVNIVMK
ncbi:MAG: leucine--tRNA ligase [Planctomycetes bacterium]|jgi:leucyl-tRNA synthetase|nr:leucine--tRNA ligase [Planctomycetota bacterium]